MSNYPCSAVHGGSDPVGKSVLYFYIFYSAGTLMVRCEREAHAVQVCKSFLFLERTITQSDVTLPSCKSHQNKMSQRQSHMLGYRDGLKLETLTPV